MLRNFVLIAAMATLTFALLYLFAPFISSPQIIDLVAHGDLRTQRAFFNSAPERFIGKGEKLKVTGCYFDKSSSFYARVELRDGEAGYVELVDGRIGLDRRPATPMDLLGFWRIVWTCGDPYYARPELQLRNPTEAPDRLRK